MRPENISARTGSMSLEEKAKTVKAQNVTVVAIPYYSQLVRQNGGLENIYFKLAIDNITGEYAKPKLTVWNPKELPSLPDWFSQQGVEAILCSDNRPGFEGLFNATGITIYWNQRGEVAEMAARWFRSNAIDQHWQPRRHRPQTAFA